MTTSEEATAEDLCLRGTVLTIIVIFGLAAIATVIRHRWGIVTDVTNYAGSLWSCGFVLAAIALTTHRPSEIPKTISAYFIALFFALLICCRRPPISLYPSPLDYINWANIVCFSIPPLGTLAAGALIRYSLWLINSGSSSKPRKR